MFSRATSAAHVSAEPSPRPIARAAGATPPVIAATHDSKEPSVIAATHDSKEPSVIAATHDSKEPSVIAATHDSKEPSVIAATHDSKEPPTFQAPSRLASATHVSAEALAPCPTMQVISTTH